MTTRIKINEADLKDMISSITEKILFGGLPKRDPTGDIHWAFLAGKPYALNEGLISTYPIDDVISSISRLFNLYDGDDYATKNKILYCLDRGEDCEYDGVIESTRAKNETKRIEIKTNRNSLNQNDFDKYFLKYGWFCGYSDDLIAYTNIVRFVYEKKFDIDVTDDIMGKKYIYHICPNIYLSRIDASGLKPKFSSWNTFSNPERVYFFITDISKSDFLNWVKHFKRGKKIHKDNGWSLLRIDTSQLKNKPTFYFDPRMKNGVYTTDTITPNSIEIIDYIE